MTHPPETYNLSALLLGVEKAGLLVPVPVSVSTQLDHRLNSNDKRVGSNSNVQHGEVRMVKVRVAAKGGQEPGLQGEKQQQQLFISLFDPTFAFLASNLSNFTLQDQKSHNGFGTAAFVKEGQGAGQAGVQVAYAIAVEEVEDKRSGGAGMGDNGVDTFLPDYGQVTCKPKTQNIISNAGSRLVTLRLLGDGDDDGIVGESGEGTLSEKTVEQSNWACNRYGRRPGCYWSYDCRCARCF